MADDQEKTEEPSSKKIEDARKEGNVPKSQDTSSFVTLVVAIGAFLALFPFIKERMFGLYRFTQSFVGVDLDKNTVHIVMITIFQEFALMILPLAAIVAISGVLASVMQFGFITTTKPLIPDLKKIDPIKGIKNLISMKKLVESIKTIVKVGLVLTVAYYYLFDFVHELPSVIFFPIYDQLLWLRDKALILIAVMLMLFLGLALFDLFFVRYNYFKDLRMSKQEIKDEYKQMEGDPQVKARIRRVQMEMVKKRMMQDIPSADVVITNPTHFAVAIRYDTEKENAPKVVAKGVDHLALKIKEIAREHNIQVVENPPLARALYKECEIEDMIPETLYKAVAEVLAFVYRSSQKDRN
ncbi:flagellar biosynthesis protein FlhB [Sulfurospirillum arcachonense]|uniref:flagellar biosynthesis protein FlhB n=1 Tax=Sulfurospirillum arcachonense TaxID=57666 RepID=UPI000469BA52|nr:flagellar biosynthesis protein FlhB [Sulfurospirillum arcachonense]